MPNQRNNLYVFGIAVLALLCLIVVWPQRPGNYLPGVIPWPGSAGIHIDMIDFHRQGFKLGLDLQGGTYLVLRADTSRVPTGDDVNSRVDGVTRVIEKRINGYGVAESIVQRRGTD